MRWLDRRGRPLPLDPIFAELHLNMQKRAGLAVSHLLQRRARREAKAERVMIQVRNATGTQTWPEESP